MGVVEFRVGGAFIAPTKAPPTGGSRHRQGLCRPCGPGGRWVRAASFGRCLSTKHQAPRFKEPSTKNREPRTKNQEPNPRFTLHPSSPPNFSAPNLSAFSQPSCQKRPSAPQRPNPTPYALSAPQRATLAPDQQRAAGLRRFAAALPFPDCIRLRLQEHEHDHENV